MNPSTVNHRQQLRKTLRHARRELSPPQQHAAAEALNQRLQLVLEVPAQRPAVVATYLASDGEIDLQPTIDTCIARGMQITLPVIHPFTAKHLLFQHYNAKTVMTKNRFGILEPKPDCSALQLLHHHDYVLLPLVGFDAQGNRLGMGGGFYDRTLASIAKCAQRPRLIGVAHDCQAVTRLPVAGWDIPLDMIVTPSHCVLGSQ